jgi:uncharacterized protein YbjT (DUF2867 family)
MKLLLFWLLAAYFSFTHGLSLDQSKASRRDFIGNSVAIAGGVIPASLLFNDEAFASDKDPFCVIGANGKTGTKCVQLLLEKSIPVRATSRSGIYDSESSSPLLMPMVCDVTNPPTVETAVKGTRAVIFAASASKAGGTPVQVDNDGLVTVAKACIAARVPHLVIVSSGSVTKPDSPVYKFLNIFGKIMDEKIKGEDAIRSLYAGVDGLTYTVIRPGGLTEEPARGVSALELNQGDNKSGRISRYDVASLCVESTTYPELTGGTTFECYDEDTGKSLSRVGMSNILKQTTGSSEYRTGKERTGDTWKALFTGLERD